MRTAIVTLLHRLPYILCFIVANWCEFDGGKLSKYLHSLAIQGRGELLSNPYVIVIELDK
jgi:hypothetical protein